MPIYEFECRSCGNEFEHMQSFSATTTPACVACGADNVVRRLGRPAIHFKGSGWYITDSKKKGASAASNGSSGNDASSNGASAGETEKKSTTTAAETTTGTTTESKPAPVAAD